MVLSDTYIRLRVKYDELVSPCEDDQINPASVNLTLGDTFLVPLPAGRRGLIELGDKVKYRRYKIGKGDDGFILNPGCFALATTRECIKLPDNIAAFVQGRSSIGRIGLTTQNAGFVDPGFNGHITLELVNEGPNAIILNPGYPVAQLVFFECYTVEKPYCGKYNGQVEATGSRMHLDKEAAGSEG